MLHIGIPPSIDMQIPGAAPEETLNQTPAHGAWHAGHRECGGGEDGVRQRQMDAANTKRAQFRGVYACGKRWKSQIHFDNCQHYLGTFDTPEEAAKAYDVAARAHHVNPKTNYAPDGTLTSARRKRSSGTDLDKRGHSSPISSPGSQAGVHPALMMYGSSSSHQWNAIEPQGYRRSPVIDRQSWWLGNSLNERHVSIWPGLEKTDELQERIANLNRTKFLYEDRLCRFGYVLSAEQREDLMDEVVVLTIQIQDLCEKINTCGC